MARTIGVLALQGAFAKHAEILQTLGVATRQIRTPDALRGCDGLIIPGGESTTLTKLMALYGFYQPIREFAQNYPVMGTCAGLILMATCVNDDRVTPLQLLEMTVQRNAYGRQGDSFSTQVPAPFLGDRAVFRTIFIRAPQVTQIGANVDVLLHWQGQPVMVCNRHGLALTFHPELTGDARIHHYFLKRF